MKGWKFVQSVRVQCRWKRFFNIKWPAWMCTAQCAHTYRGVSFYSWWTEQENKMHRKGECLRIWKKKCPFFFFSFFKKRVEWASLCSSASSSSSYPKTKQCIHNKVSWTGCNRISKQVIGCNSWTSSFLKRHSHPADHLFFIALHVYCNNKSSVFQSFFRSHCTFILRPPSPPTH